MIRSDQPMTEEQQRWFKSMEIYNEFYKVQEADIWDKEAKVIGVGTQVKYSPRMYTLKTNVKLTKFIYEVVEMFKHRAPTTTIVFAIRPPMVGDKASVYVDLWVRAYDIDDFQRYLQIWLGCAADIIGTIGPTTA